jgi:hypothetical protein
VEQCEQVGLVWGKELYIDSTKVLANASADSMAPRFAVEAHLETLFGCESQEQEDQPATEDAPQSPPITLPTVLSEDAYQDRAEANEGRHDWIAEAGQQNRAVVGHDYRRIADFEASTTDPDASLMRSAGAGSRPGYQTHYVVDGGKARIIRTALVAPSEVMENLPMRDLIWHTCFRWKVVPHQVTGDAKYGTIENIVALEEMGVRAYLALPDYRNRTPFFGLGRFTYDPERDLYRCPQGQVLQRMRIVKATQVVRYRADAKTCQACPLRSQCTTSKMGRQVERSVYTDYVDRVRGYHQTAAYQKAMRKRNVWGATHYCEIRRRTLREYWQMGQAPGDGGRPQGDDVAAGFARRCASDRSDGAPGG